MDQLENLVGHRVTGTVKSWKDPWGFATSPEFAGDLFVHSIDVVGGSLSTGATVECDVGTDQKTGKPRGLKIMVTEAVGLNQDPSESSALERMEGILEKWKEPWGWIVCPGLENTFAHRQEVEGGLDVQMLQGSEVSFELGVDAKTGKPRALRIRVSQAGGSSDSLSTRVEGVVDKWKEPWGWISCPSIEGNIFAHREEVLNGNAAVPLHPGTQVSFVPGLDKKTGKNRALRIELVGGRQNGVIKSWREDWGWISSPQITDGDIFVHAEDCGGCPPVGTGVSFEVGLDAKSNRRKARNVISLATSSMTPFYGKAGDYSMGKGKINDVQGKGWGAPAGGSYHGVVKSWQKDWGWITSPQIPTGDIFAHAEDAGGCLPVGAEVTFDIGIDEKSRRQRARRIAPVGWTEMAGKGGKGVDFGKGSDYSYGKEGAFYSMGKGKELVSYSWPSAKGYDMSSGKGYDMGGAKGSFDNSFGWSNPKGFGGKGVAQGFLPQEGGVKRKAPSESQDIESFQILEGQYCEGTVRTWKIPWGFIQSASFRGDLFAHKEEVISGQDLEPGQSVNFVMGRDPKSGRWRATMINESVGELAQKRLRTE